MCTLPVIPLAPSPTALLEETLRRLFDLKTEIFCKILTAESQK